jgi:hypothetical protein
VSRSIFVRAGLIAVAFTLAQIGMCLLFAPGPSTPPGRFLQRPLPPGWNQSIGQENPLLFRYIRLNNWDSFHYFSIAQDGYHAPAREWRDSDVAQYQLEFSFLPAFPLFAAGLSKLTSLPLEIALPLASQISAFFFYIFFFLILTLLCELSHATAVKVMGLFVLTPGAFYLVTGYSEALFLCSLAGMVLFTELWARERNKSYGLLSVLFGLVGSWTRIMGLVLALFPLCFAFRSKVAGRWRLGALAFAAITGLGTGGYFVFCHVYSGHWDAYFRLYKIGWGMRTWYLGALNPFIYIPRFFFEEGEISLHRGLLLVCLLGITGSLWKDSNRRERSPYYALVLGLFYMTVAGKAGMGFEGMLRYILPILWVTLLLVVSVFRDQVNLAFKQRWIWILVILLLLKLETFYAHRYLYGLWVS